jgi:DNA repair ATPase RecN
MDLRVVRKVLLSQHEQLRTMMTELEAALEGRADERVIKEKVEAVKASLHRHSEEEEATLRPILETIDAWGPQRVEAMIAEHEAEHERLERAYDPTRLDAKNLGALMELIREHMAREESGMLSEKLLRNDVVIDDAD